MGSLSSHMWFRFSVCAHARVQLTVCWLVCISVFGWIPAPQIPVDSTSHFLITRLLGRKVAALLSLILPLAIRSQESCCLTLTDRGTEAGLDCSVVYMCVCVCVFMWSKSTTTKIPGQNWKCWPRKVSSVQMLVSYESQKKTETKETVIKKYVASIEEDLVTRDPLCTMASPATTENESSPINQRLVHYFCWKISWRVMWSQILVTRSSATKEVWRWER